MICGHGRPAALGLAFEGKSQVIRQAQEVRFTRKILTPHTQRLPAATPDRRRQAAAHPAKRLT